MSDKAEMDRYIEVGKRNLEVIGLVQKWCAHAKIIPQGVGMMAVQLRLPIGHHSMACDHAPFHGMAAWEFSEVALDFYDHACVGCPHRKPVGLPNLSRLVAERDAVAKQAELAEQATALEIEAQRAARQAARAALRVGLSPGAANVVDQLGDLDAARTAALEDTLVATARLAPEVITPEIAEHLFGLIEAEESWADGAALKILAAAHADPKRLVHAAITCLRRGTGGVTAVALFLRRAALAEPSLIPGALPALVRLANSRRQPFNHARARPGPLIRIHAAHPTIVRDAIASWLDRDTPGLASRAARAVEILAPRARETAVFLARNLIARLSRSAWVPDTGNPLSDDTEEVARDLREAIAEVFLADPPAVDTLLQNSLLGASATGEVRIASVYARVLHRGRSRKTRPISDGDRLAFQRLFWVATTSRNERVLKEVQGTIHGQPGEYLELAVGEVDNLLGAALQMDEQVRKFDAEPAPTTGDFLAGLERGNRRFSLAALRDAFVAWAAAGAAAGDPNAYLKVLANLPEDREELIASMVAAARPLMATAEGLNAVLPTLYRALVGASVRGRAGAADLIGKMNSREREDAPDLLMEAFCALLTDPFYMVHIAAVSALRSFRAPEAYAQRIRAGLVQVFHWHMTDEKHDGVVLDCARMLAVRHFNEAECSGPAGATLIRVLRRLKPMRLSDDLRTFVGKLGRAEGMLDLLVDLLNDPEVSEHSQDKILDALARMPPEVVYAGRAHLAALPNLRGWEDRRTALEVSEILSRAGAWAEAETLSARILDSVPDTTWEAETRRHFGHAQIVVRFEAALARGDVSAAQAEMAAWRADVETAA